MKLLLVFCICFAAALAVPAPLPDVDEDQDQFDDQQDQQFRRRLQKLSLSLFDDDDRIKNGDRDDRRDRDNRRDRDDRRDHVQRERDDKDHTVQRDRDVQRVIHVQRDDRRDLHDRDQADRDDFLRKSHLDLISNVLGRITNQHPGRGSLKISYNPHPLNLAAQSQTLPLPTRLTSPRVHDLGSISFKYYAPPAPIHHVSHHQHPAAALNSIANNEPATLHALVMRQGDEDRFDDDDDDDDDLQ